MKINVCVNGTFRYPQYIRYFNMEDALGVFYFSHRLATTAGSMGLPKTKVRNYWLKEYCLHAALKLGGGRRSHKMYTEIGKLWQSSVIRNWVDCDSVEVVTGGIADRVLAHAKMRGSKILGHPVNSHPIVFSELIRSEYERLGVSRSGPLFVDLKNRLREIELCDGLIVDSSFVKKSFVDNGYPENRIEVIRPGNDLERFTPRSPEEVDARVFRVVCVGAISARKGQRYLLEAWRSLNLPNAELVLVGQEADAAGAVLSGFTGTFRHVPHVANAELRKILVTASVFVLPAIEDGFAQSPLEALSCGIPTIVTSNMGNADVIDDGVNGYIVPARDTQAIAVRLEELYRDREKARNMGEAAALSGHMLFWSEYVERVLRVHRKLMNGS